ncbi:MAG: glucokinase [Cyanobacteria bacterium P01_G01_bin.54]
MTILLAGDIGGTNTRLKLYQGTGSQLTPLSEIQTYPSQNYPSLTPVVQEFFSGLQPAQTPTRACFAIAGPVQNNTSLLTNIDWQLDGNQLQQDLGLERVQLINDFVAIGYGITGLQDADLERLQPGKPNPQAPRAILGAGTGMGQCFVIPRSQGGYQVFPTEGGHVDFAPRNAQEFALAEFLKAQKGIQRVSVERVVSGQGIADIYRFLRTQTPDAESATIQAQLATPDADFSAVIGKAALEKSDPLCVQAVELFISAYGSEAGNLALKLLPFGGLYLAGGIAAKLLPWMRSPAFIESYHTKGRMSPLLDDVPMAIVLNPEVGLLGAGICAAQED